MTKIELLMELDKHVSTEDGEDIKFAILVYVSPQNVYITEIKTTPAECIAALDNAKFMKQLGAFVANNNQKGVGMTS